jgi:hypothetical protein
MGFYGVFLGLQYQNDLAMSRALDADIYDPANAITLKIPVSIPYVPDESDFERATGQFEHNGELYRKVKQRYAEDTLTVVCVKDNVHKKIDLAITDYVKTFADGSIDFKPTSKIIVTFLKDYLPVFVEINSATEGWALLLVHNPFRCNLLQSHPTSITQPPERA